MSLEDEIEFRKQKKTTVVLVGWYGAGNMGDELLLGTMIRAVRLYGKNPIVVSLDPTYTTHYHLVESIDFEDLDALQSAMEGAYACVAGGGGLFQTYSTFRYASLFEFNLGDVSSYARPILLAKQLGVPTALLAQGVGPLTTPESKVIVRSLFSSVSFASVRDVASRDLLRSIGVVRDIVLAPDPIWGWSLPATSQLNCVQNKKKIVLVVRDWSFVSDWEDRLLSALRETFDPVVHELLWLPFQARDIPGRSSSDISLLRRLMAQLGPHWNQDLLEWSSIPEAIEMLASADAVIAMRMHAQILALKLNKPTLCLEYDEKMAQVSLQAGVPNERRVRLIDDQSVWLRAMKSLLNDGVCSFLKDDGFRSFAKKSDMHFDLLWENIEISVQGNIDCLNKNTNIGSIDWLWFWRTWQQKDADEFCRLTELKKGSVFSCEETDDFKSLSFYGSPIDFEIGMRALHARNVELQVRNVELQQELEKKLREIIAERCRYNQLHVDNEQALTVLRVQAANIELLESKIQNIYMTRSMRLIRKLCIGFDFFRSLLARGKK